MSNESIRRGYDHYWNFHDDPKEWADKGCPICKMLLEDRKEDQ